MLLTCCPRAFRTSRFPLPPKGFRDPRTSPQSPARTSFSASAYNGTLRCRLRALCLTFLSSVSCRVACFPFLSGLKLSSGGRGQPGPRRIPIALYVEMAFTCLASLYVASWQVHDSNLSVVDFVTARPPNSQKSIRSNSKAGGAALLVYFSAEIARTRMTYSEQRE